MAIIGAVSAISGSASGAEIVFPTAAEMVRQADVVAVGRVTGADRPVFHPAAPLKGPVQTGRAYALENPHADRSFGFDLGALAGLTGEGETLLLGGLDPAGGAIRLEWINGSVWPHGYAPDTFPSGSVEQCADFVRRLLGYGAMAATPDRLAQTLLADIRGAGEAPPHAALAYLEVAAHADLAAPLPWLLRALGVAAAARNPAIDAPAMEELAILAPDLPPSLAAPILLDLAERAPEPAARSLRNAVWPMLSARGARTVGPHSTADALRDALKPMLPALRRADARRALSGFDTGLPSFDGRFADFLMKEIVGREPAGQPPGGAPAARRAAWARLVDGMRD